ncbi:hypothetical protein ACFQZK_13380 [Rhodococcus aetherivorans]
MDLALLGTLAVLALVDSTSLGTLVVPLWLLTVPGRPPYAACWCTCCRSPRSTSSSDSC